MAADDCFRHKLAPAESAQTHVSSPSVHVKGRYRVRRTGEGRDRAKARSVKLGRKPLLTEHQKCEAIRRRDRDGEPVREIARTYNVSHSPIPRLTA